jgi:hypothetical protein
VRIHWVPRLISRRSRLGVVFRSTTNDITSAQTVGYRFGLASGQLDDPELHLAGTVLYYWFAEVDPVTNQFSDFAEAQPFPITLLGAPS